MSSSARRSSMTVSTLSTEVVLKELRQALTVYGNQKVAAKAWHASAPYLSDAELGRDQLTTVPRDFELKLEEIQ